MIKGVWNPKGIQNRTVLALMLGLLAGCAGVPSEQLAQMATVEVADGYALHSVDAEARLFSMSVNVAPGPHTFQMTLNCYNNNCVYQTYRFNAEAGRLYRLMPGRTILVLDRNDRYQRKLGDLTLYGSSGIDYGDPQQIQSFNQEVAKQRAAEWNVVMERRRMNLPLVRKIGAKVCQVRGQFRYIGFVEATADEKVQIRVVEGVANDRSGFALADFKQQITWDSPLNWDLCE